MPRRVMAVIGGVVALAGVLAARQLPGTGRAAVPPASPQAIERAATILADGRRAMGGDALAAVHTVVATGRTQRVRGNNLVPIEFELAIERPDKYVRRDEVPAEESGPTANGFAGEEVIQTGAPPARGGGSGRAGGLQPPPAARLLAARQEFTRLSLGLLLDSLPAYPVTFAFAVQAAAPQGMADVLDVTGAGGFTARLFIDHETHLPIMLSWQAPPTSVIVTTPGQPPPANVPAGAVIVAGPPVPAAAAAQDEKDAYTKATADLRRAAQATPVENRLYYADYRSVEGVRLPFRLRRAIGGETTEETTFDRFRLNTRIDPRRFATK